MRKLALLLVIVGLFFIINGGYQIIKTNKAQDENLAKAKSIINHNQTNQQTPDDSIFPDDESKNFNPAQGETVGILSIPRLDSELPIIEGTHEDELAQGVGHYGGTSYPLQNDQIVLSGHRDTVFRRMGELELGDILTVQMPYGDVSYEITDLQIVDADDRSIIVPTGEEVLTVTTCYPFSYVGSAPDRYIITALPTNE